MALNLEASSLFAAGSAVLVMLLGVFVASIRPRGRANLAFAVFAFFFGAGFVGRNLLTQDTPEKPIITLVEAVFFLIAAVGLAAVARLQIANFRRAWSAGLVFGVAHLVGIWVINFASPILGAPEPLSADNVRAAGGLSLVNSVAWGAGLAFAIRYVGFGPDKTRERQSLALMTIGIIVYPTAVATLVFAPIAPLDRYVGVLVVVMGSILALAWVLAMTRSPEPKVARGVVWAVLAMTLAFMWGGTQGPFEVVGGPIVGTARTLAVAIFAYAIIRHQLFDIDLKLKWTIKQSTVAAAFVAVFFTVSEVAQSVFQSSLGSIAGIIAAGALVFAIAPLQRFAERVSETALPGVKDTAEYRLVRKREVYRAAIEAALADGEITGKERSMLASLQDQLGLSASDALELEREAAAKGAT
jgi:hypothetical protein